jgi:hypothetical protein
VPQLKATGVDRRRHCTKLGRAARSVYGEVLFCPAICCTVHGGARRPATRGAPFGRPRSRESCRISLMNSTTYQSQPTTPVVRHVKPISRRKRRMSPQIAMPRPLRCGKINILTNEPSKTLKRKEGRNPGGSFSAETTHLPGPNPPVLQTSQAHNRENAACPPKLASFCKIAKSQPNPAADNTRTALQKSWYYSLATGLARRRNTLPRQSVKQIYL